MAHAGMHCLHPRIVSVCVCLDGTAANACRWAESELLDALCRLELGLAGHVEGWKAARWASKLGQLKGRNDRLAAGLEAAAARLANLEDAAQEAGLRAEQLEVRGL